jgi:hypothetical protein
VDKPPSPQNERTTPDSLKPSSPKGAQGSPSAGGASNSPTHTTLDQDPTGASSVLEPTESHRASPPTPGLMDLGQLVGLSEVRARPHHSLNRFHDNVNGS